MGPMHAARSHERGWPSISHHGHPFSQQCLYHGWHTDDIFGQDGKRRLESFLQRSPGDAEPFNDHALELCCCHKESLTVG